MAYQEPRLLRYRDNPKRSLEDDIDWALFTFKGSRQRAGQRIYMPANLNEEQKTEFQQICNKLNLDLQENPALGKKYFEVE